MIIQDTSTRRGDSPSISANIYTGIVREENYSESTDTLSYLVEVISQGRSFSMSCTQLVKSGDAYNYEEIKLRHQNTPSPLIRPDSWSTRVGEIVLVAPIDGNHLQGVILGALRHPGRALKLTDDSIAYASEFNGLETTINSTGAYKVKFKGAPVTVALLENTPPGVDLPPPIYNPSISGSFFGFDNHGTYTVSDGMGQSITIDKSGKSIAVKSGLSNVNLDITGKIGVSGTDLAIAGKLGVDIASNISIKLKSNVVMSMSAPQIAIGYNGIELIDSLIQIVDGIGNLVVNSPVGPCQPLSTSPLWPPILALKIKLQTIKGSL